MDWRLLICLFLFIIVNICAGKGVCPNEKEIEPCHCYGDNQKLSCGLAHEDPTASEEILRRVFRKVVKYEFQTVSISDCALTYIPHDLFTDITIDTIYLRNLTLSDMFEEPPTSLAGIKNFGIQESKLFRSFVWEHLSVMTQLESLVLLEIPVKILKKDISKYVSKSLKFFALRNSETKSFKPGVFDDFVNLEKFHMDTADLKELRRDFFPRPFNSIKDIAFRALSLKSIPDGMFADMPNLETLDLSNNHLTTLDVDVFGQHNKRVEINLYNNPLHCDCRFSYVFYERKTNFDPSNGECATPEYLKGFDVRDVDQYLHCP